MRDTSFRYDTLRTPSMGQALNELMLEQCPDYTWSGPFSFTTKEEYESSIVFYNSTVSDEEKEIDNITGLPKHQKTYEQVNDIVPSWDQIVVRFADIMNEYNAYAGKRARQYPDLREQLDMIYKDIDAGLMGDAAKTSTFYTAIKQIKDENP